MKFLPQGSIPWLLAHELRLSWRGRGAAGKGRRRAWIVMLVLLAVLTIPGWFTASALKGREIPLIPEVALMVDLVLGLIFTLMMSTTVAATAVAFYERGDLDLLLASPIPPRRVLTVRCVGIALQSILLFVFLITPFAVPGLLLGDLRWANGYLLFLAMGLLAAAFGLIIAMFLFRLIGPKRTRSAATILSALIGVSFGLFGQARNFVGQETYDRWIQQVMDLAKSGLFAKGQPLAWPTQALIGDHLVAGAMIGVALIVFTLVTQSIGRTFGGDAAAAAGAGTKARVAKGALPRFRGGLLGVVVHKELKLIRRDATLLSQTLIQVLYLGVVFGAIMFKNISQTNHWLQGGAAALLVFLAGQLAGVFGWIVMSAEDSPELLAASPAPTKTLRRGKLIAAVIPVALVMAIPVAGLGWLDLWAGLGALVGCAAVAVSAGLLAIWFERPAKRSELRRRRNGSWTGLIIGTIVGMCWAGTAFLIAMHLPWAIAALGPAIIGVVIMGAVSKPDRSFAETLQMSQQAS